jgi:hypothetical protein
MSYLIFYLHKKQIHAMQHILNSLKFIVMAVMLVMLKLSDDWETVFSVMYLHNFSASLKS